MYEIVRNLFRYNGENLVWDVRRSGATKGRVAGKVLPDGYRYVRVDGKWRLAHRIVWLHQKGYLPENGLDHINRNRSDNRLCNLREASKACNMRNAGNPMNNTSGVKGVSFDSSRKKWLAHIMVSKKLYNLGRTADFGEAVLLRFAAEQCLGWESCDANSPARKYAISHNLISTK